MPKYSISNPATPNAVRQWARRFAEYNFAFSGIKATLSQGTHQYGMDIPDNWTLEFTFPPNRISAIALRNGTQIVLHELAKRGWGCWCVSPYNAQDHVRYFNIEPGIDHTVSIPQED